MLTCIIELRAVSNTYSRLGHASNQGYGPANAYRIWGVIVYQVLFIYFLLIFCVCLVCFVVFCFALLCCCCCFVVLLFVVLCCVGWLWLVGWLAGLFLSLSISATATAICSFCTIRPPALALSLSLYTILSTPSLCTIDLQHPFLHHLSIYTILSTPS